MCITAACRALKIHSLGGVTSQSMNINNSMNINLVEFRLCTVRDIDTTRISASKCFLQSYRRQGGPHVRRCPEVLVT